MIKGMLKNILIFVLLFHLSLGMVGCVFLVGGALGAVGGYMVSKDTIQGETDKGFDSIWDSAIEVSKIMGTIKFKDRNKGIIELDIDRTIVKINLEEITPSTQRLKVSARNKYLLPEIKTAQKVFIKIMQRIR